MVRKLFFFKVIFAVVALFLTITSCKKEDAKPSPTADFSYTGAGTAPSTVAFTNASTNATSYAWDFGDNGTSTDPNPQHTYGIGGVYTVKLTATGGGGSSSTSKTINIATPATPVANFTFVGNGIAPSNVTFTNTSTNATTYLWDFGDNSGTSTLQNPQHLYTIAGTYNIKLIATGTGGSNSTTLPVVILPPNAPTANFLYTGAGTAPSTVFFTNTSTNATSYAWDFGDNGTSNAVNPQHLYTTGGVYTVTLTATGAGGSTTTTKTVNIGAAFTKVKITKVTVVNIPFTKPGGTSGWDLDGTGPDIYFQIQDVSSNVLFNAGASSRYNDITPSTLPIAWNLTTPFEIPNLGASRYIQLIDYDFGTSNDDMGYVGFQMSNYTSGANPYPSTVTNTQNGITVTLNLTWY